MSDKEYLRSRLLVERKSLSIDEVNNKSKIIQKKLEECPLFQKSGNVLFYVSYGHEVFTHDLIKKSLQTKKNVLVSRSNTKTFMIDPIMVNNWTDLVNGAYGILEPTKENNHIYHNIDLIIIPGIGFDIQGNRLGHGKGYYDRLIEKNPKAALIALAYDFQIVNSIPTGLHDKPVDIIISEKQTIICK
ncbi:5-formyltetrahydrofolate cyclo-ligase [Thermoplasmatales archaeon ex4572_165]|nr:MAG: 5-formyltetrahydrofolate cyclo-ligase [Thermoplasmatales archaeon ex4572_165]